MKKETHRKKNFYLFFRSLFVSSVLIFCAMFLVLGCGECYAKMQTSITGEEISLLEKRDGRILLLGRDIGSAEALEWLEN